MYWTFNDSDYTTAQSLAAPAQAALVFVQSDSAEALGSIDGNMGDRNDLNAWNNGNKLIEQVAAVNNNTIVVIQSGAQVTTDPWVTHPNVTAILWAGMPGSEAGNALADVLYGRVNPSGRLPFTIARRREDYSADVIYKEKSSHTPIYYSEGLHVDYRWFDLPGSPEPRFSFGHGLSYTSFDYSHASGRFLQPVFDTNTSKETYPAQLFDDVFEFSFNVTNNGTTDGFEVPQAYLSFPKHAGEPPKVLRKFDRFAINTNQTTTITWRLNTYDLSVWDTVKQKWVVPKGQTTLLIGAGSRDIRLSIPVA